MRRWWAPIRSTAVSVGRVAAGGSRAARRFPSWLAASLRRPGTRLGLHGLAIVGVLAAAVYTGLYVVPSGAHPRPAAAPSSAPATGAPEPPGGGAPAPEAPVEPTVSASASPPPNGQPGRPQDALAGWAAKMQHLGIPAVAMQAYGYAELTLARTQPECKLTWPTLAGIGSIESNHGQAGGSQIRADGRSEPPVIGLPLDGGPDREKIPDTDSGELDGDTRYDRAVGAMQFIPDTWQRWATDGDGDGVTDPFDIDDAALAAGRYLCADGRNLSTGEGWSAAIYSYNHMDSYVRAVFAAADQYGQMSRSGG